MMSSETTIILKLVKLEEKGFTASMKITKTA
jgi:hypothetical protein